jgi:hypothetical protein
MSRRVTELEKLFDEYNQSLQIVWTGATDTFVCPLCMNSFKKEDIYNGNLSLEHVPPKSIRTIYKTMTCTRCNNTIGSKLQRFMVNDVRRKELEAGVELKEPFPAKVREPDFQFDTTITSATGRNWVGVSPLSILPPNLKSLESMEKIAGKKGIVSLKGLGTEEKLDRAYLHSSYLMLFSLLGYPYIMQPFMEGIRQQINEGQPSIRARVAIPPKVRRRMPFFDPREKGVEVSFVGTATDLTKSCLALVTTGEMILMPLISDYYQAIHSVYNSIMSDSPTNSKKRLPFDTILIEIDPLCKYSAGYVFEKGRRVGEEDTLKLSPVRVTDGTE